MGEFFKGWRRKFGVVTLVMACGFMLFWARSFDEGAIFWFRTSSHWWEFVGSMHGLLIFGSKHDPVIQSFSSRWTIIPSSNEWLDNWWIAEWRWSGFSSCESLRIADQPSVVARMWTLPYWFIVLPLTMLSTYLLLTKPRAAKKARIFVNSAD